MDEINQQILEQLRQMNRLMGGDVSSGVKPKAATMDLKDEAIRVNLRKSVNEYAKGLKEATSVTKSMTNVFDGLREEFDFEQSAENLKQLDVALAKTTDTVEIAAIKEAKAEMTKAVAMKTAIMTAANFAGGMLKAANMVLEASRNFELAIQGGASGVEAGTQNLIASIQAQKQIMDTAADTVKDLSGGLGTLLMVIPGLGMVAKVIGGLISILGPFISSFMKFNNEQEAKAAEHRVKIFGEELKKTQDTYNQLTSAGALFAGGMTEMRAQAANAGMRMKDFGEAVKHNVELLANMGMTVTDAAIRMGNVRKIIKDSDLNMQFRALGMESKEQAEAIALASVSLNNAGQLRTASDKTVASTAFQYAKDLKVLQELTGQDAKKKMEAAQKETMAADIRAKLLAEDPTGESLKRFEKVFTIVPEELKKGFLEKISTGGSAIADASFNIANAQNSQVGTLMDTFYRDVMDKTKTASEALDSSYAALGAAGRATLADAESYSVFAMATRITADGTLQGANSIQTAMIQAGVTIKEGAVQSARETVEKTATTVDPLTESINKLEIETEAAAVQLEERLTPKLAAAADEMPRFTKAMQDVVDALRDMVNKNLKVGSQGLPSLPITKELAQAKAAAGQNVEEDEFRTAASQKIKSIKDMGWLDKFLLGSDMVKRREKAEASGLTPEQAVEAIKKNQFARGGIARGPETGFAAMLHGTEAVVPLPDGKTVPVSINLGQDFSQSMQAGQNRSADWKQSVLAAVAQQVGQNKSSDFLVSSAALESANKIANAMSGSTASQVGAFETISAKLGSIGNYAVDAVSKIADNSAAKEQDTELFKTMSQSLALLAQKPATTNNDAVFAEMRDLIKAQIGKHDEMITQLKDVADINQRLLNQSYS